MTFTTTNTAAARVLAVFTALMLVLSAFPFHALAVQYPDDPSVGICHATNSHSNPYNTQSVNASSIINLPNGHNDHTGPVWFEGIEEEWGDIIPPFTYDLGEGEMQYDGLNWTAEGRAIWEADCETPEPEPETVLIKFVKKFDGENPQGFEPEEFSFLVTGDGFSEELSHDEEFEFSAGDFTVEEKGPAEFDHDDWRIKWTCPDVHMSDDDDNDHDATFEVTEDNYKDGSIFCTAENQYRPVDEEVDPTIIVQKVTNVDTAQGFDFDASWIDNGVVDFTLENGGEYDSGNIGIGTHSVTEVNIPAGWTLASVECTSNIPANNPVTDNTSITLEDEEVVTCVFTNRFDNPDAGSINGFKWNDADRSLEWEDSESGLSGWTIELYDGETLEATTTTNEDGEYWFTDLIPGSYSVCEVQQDGWFQTYPTEDGCHDVEVTEESKNHTDRNFGNKQNPDNPSDMCEIEGHKYDEEGTPLSNWDIGLLKIISHDSGTDVYDLATDITDDNGYYCLEWDGESREIRGESTYVDGEYSFVYRVYEVLKDGWFNVGVEEGPDHENLSVVPSEDITDDGSEVSIQIGEENGVIEDGAAYHVDFYNEEEGDNPPDEWSCDYFTANPGSVFDGESIELSWGVTDADFVSIDQGIGDVASTGATTTVVADAPTTYTLTASRYVGEQEELEEITCDVTVNESTSGGGGGGGGGGSSSPRCESFTAEEDGDEITLTWETRRGREIDITANGDEIFTSDDDDTVDEGSFVTTASGDTEFVLTVHKGSKSRTCSVEIERGDGTVLGEQVSVVPLGAADTGAGGTSPNGSTTPAAIMIAMLVGSAVRFAKNAK